jgi:hypothetical protein
MIVDDPPLFSKNVDDLLPPGPTPDGKAAARSRLIRPADPPTRAADSPQEPELRWWLSALGGGIAILLIFFIRLVVRGIGDGFAGIDWLEMAGIACLVFALGCLLGLAFWGFDWLKWRFSRSER